MSLPKLVRDKIPQIIEQEGQTPVFEKARENEAAYFLFSKIEEEVGEFKLDPSLEEAADIYEAFIAICNHFDLSIREVLKTAESKRMLKGSFDEYFILKSVKTKGETPT